MQIRGNETPTCQKMKLVRIVCATASFAHVSRLSFGRWRGNAFVTIFSANWTECNNKSLQKNLPCVSWIPLWTASWLITTYPARQPLPSPIYIWWHSNISSLILKEKHHNLNIIFHIEMINSSHLVKPMLNTLNCLCTVAASKYNAKFKKWVWRIYKTFCFWWDQFVVSYKCWYQQ